jgi:hypothetical protein
VGPASLAILRETSRRSYPEQMKRPHGRSMQANVDNNKGASGETGFARGRASFFGECYQHGGVTHRVLLFALAWTEVEEISGDGAELPS